MPTTSDDEGDQRHAAARGRGPGLAEDQRRKDHRHQHLDGEHHRRDVGRAGRLLQGTHLAQQRQPLRGHRGGQPGNRDQQRPGGQLVGQELAGDGGPGVAEAGAEDGEKPRPRTPPPQQVGRGDRDRHQSECGRSRPCRRGRWCAPAPPRPPPRPRRRSPPPRGTRASPASPPASSPPATAEDQPADQAGLHHGQRRQQQRHDLQRPPTRPNAVAPSQRRFRTSLPISDGRSECSCGTPRTSSACNAIEVL